MTRDSLFDRHPWLAEPDIPMVVSADLEGLLCAAILHHHLGWQLAGMGRSDQTWLDANRVDSDEELYVGINLTDLHARSITCAEDRAQDTVNPLNFLEMGVSVGPFPLSLPLFLLWLYDIPIRRDLTGRLLLLAVGDTLTCFNDDPTNFNSWLEQLPGYDWPWLFAKVGTGLLNRRLEDQLYRPLAHLLRIDLDHGLGAVSLNPDWDSDTILNFLAYTATTLKWSPPSMPLLSLVG